MKRILRRAGFTVAELVVSVGILAVLVSLAVPAVISTRADLELIELDSAAQTVFAAAQNRLSSLAFSGAAPLGTTMESAPADFPAGLAWSDRFACLSDAQAHALLPEGSLESGLEKGHYLIEYDRENLAVYSVFYSRDPISYADADSFRIDRAARRRAGLAVGYYGGSGVDSAPELVTLTLDAQIVNQDELYLKLTPGSAVLDYTVKVGALGETESFSFRSTDTVSVSLAYDNAFYYGGSYYLVLDSMTEGLRLHDLFPTFAPGADLTVTVSATGRSAGGDVLRPTSRSFTVNSLFESVNGGVARIGWARHLQNLKADHSGVSGISAATQIRDIDWTPASTDGERPYAARPALFRPIENGELRRFSGNGNEIIGLVVAPAGEDRNAAPFGSFNNGIMENVRICGLTVTGSAVTTNAGGLIGSAWGSTIRNCAVYTRAASGTLRPCSVTSGSVAGGLIGTAVECEVSDCSASLRALSSDTFAGGLLGVADQCSVLRCYASTGEYAYDEAAGEGSWLRGLGGSGSAAGLIASASALELTDCYAAGYAGAAGRCAGLAFGDAASSYTRCYAALEFASGTGERFGLAEHGTADVCYYLETSMSCATGVGTAMTAMQLCALDLDDDGAVWVRAMADTSAPYGTPELIYPFCKLRGLTHHGDWPAVDATLIGDVELAYYEIYDLDGSYTMGLYNASPNDETLGPINTLRSEKIVQDGYLLLFPEDSAGSFSYRGMGFVSLESACRVNGATGMLKNVSALPWSLTLSGSPFGATGSVPLGEKRYYPYFLDGAEVVTSAEETTFYRPLRVECGGMTAMFYYNPHFAKSPILPSLPADGTAIAVSIRTPRHFAALGAQRSWSDVTFTQERDLVIGAGSGYTDDYFGLALTGANARYLSEPRPIGTQSVPFLGSYLGGGHSIDFSTRSFTAAPYAPFGVIGGGRMANLTVKNATLDASSHLTLTTLGGLAGELRGGTVENITLRAVSLTGGGSAGLLAGTVTGDLGALHLGALTLEDCALTARSGGAEKSAYGLLFGSVSASGTLGLDVSALTFNNCTFAATSVSDADLGGYIGRFAASGAQSATLAVSGAELAAFDMTAGERVDLGGFLGLLGANASVTGNGLTFAGEITLNATGLSVESGTTLRAASGNIGGFVGASAGSVSGVTAKNIVTLGSGSIGGFAGSITGGTTEHCDARLHVENGSAGFFDQFLEWIGGQGGSAVDAATGSIGGFVGTVSGSDTQIASCFAAMPTHGGSGSSVGGFAGKILSASVTRCYASGKVVDDASPNASSNICVGGFVGEMNADGTTGAANARVRNCYAAGDVAVASGADGNNVNFYAGGFVGRMLAGEANNCYSKGKVGRQGIIMASLNTSSRIGGFVGNFSGLEGGFDHCYFLRTGGGTYTSVNNGNSSGTGPYSDHSRYGGVARLSSNEFLNEANSPSRLPDMGKAAGYDYPALADVGNGVSGFQHVS